MYVSFICAVEIIESKIQCRISIKLKKNVM